METPAEYRARIDGYAARAAARIVSKEVFLAHLPPEQRGLAYNQNTYRGIGGTDPVDYYEGNTPSRGVYGHSWNNQGDVL